MTATEAPEVAAMLPAESDVPQAPREVAEHRAAAIRGALEFAVDLFIAAYRERDYVALGYGTGQTGWEAYLADRYGDLNLRLPADMRRDRVEELARGGMTSVRAIAAVPGMGSKSQTAEDLKALKEAGRIVEGEVIGIDGKRQQRKPAPAKRAEVGTVDRLVAAAEALIASGKHPDGVTTLDLMARLRWRQGPASAAQSRARKRGRLVWAGTWRDGFAVYTVPRPQLPAPPGDAVPSGPPRS